MENKNLSILLLIMHVISKILLIMHVIFIGLNLCFKLAIFHMMINLELVEYRIKTNVSHGCFLNQLMSLTLFLKSHYYTAVLVIINFSQNLFLTRFFPF